MFVFNMKKQEQVNHIDNLISEFWKVTNELKIIRESYKDTHDLYIDCTIYDINAKQAYRDVLLKEIREHSKVAAVKCNIHGIIEE